IFSRHWSSDVCSSDLVLCGLQKYIQDHLMRRITREEVEEAALICEQHGIPFNRAGWMTIVDRHGGFLPIEVRAVPEGTPVPLGRWEERRVGYEIVHGQ